MVYSAGRFSGMGQQGEFKQKEIKMKKFESSKRLMWFFALLLPAVMAGCADKNGGPTSAPPSVTATFPARAVTTAPTNTSITATFSEAMDPTTVDSTTFTLRVFNTTGVTDLITGTVTLDPASNIATFDPADDLQPSTAYSATITTGVKSLASGKAMEAEYNWSFTTGLTADNTAPAVISTSEYGTTGLKSGLTGLPINRASTATFNKTMESLTLSSPATNFTVEEVESGANVAGTVTYSGTTATFTPTGNLTPNTEYRSTIKVGAKDLAGISITAPYVWSWKTAATEDNASPTLISTNPTNLATNIPIDKKITAKFSEPMKQSTIITTNFTVNEKLTPFTNVPGTVSYDVQNNIATFSPEDNLKFDTEYTVLVTSGATDLAGNALVVRAEAGVETPNPWTFTTSAEQNQNLLAPNAIPLRSAGSFGIMATLATTSTGATQINGDVALNPGTSQGIPVPQVNGEIHINDAASLEAKADLLAAYAFAKALPPGATIAAGADLGALYPLGIPPGTYTSGSTMLISTPLLLDGGGDDNAVWIFQIGSSLTTEASITLTGGAQAKNIFWVPTDDATVGIGTTFYGTIVVGRDATAVTGAIINGRILAGARTDGTIALQNTTVNVPQQ